MKPPALNRSEFEQLAQLIEPMPVGLLTGVDNDGRPVGESMPAMAMDDDGAIWLFADLGPRRLDPWEPMTLSFGDHASAGFVALSGLARIETDRMLVEALWSPFAERWFPDGPDSERIGLLKFVPRSGERWDARRERMVGLFDTAAPVAMPGARPRDGAEEVAEEAALAA